MNAELFKLHQVICNIPSLFLLDFGIFTEIITTSLTFFTTQNFRPRFIQIFNIRQTYMFRETRYSWYAVCYSRNPSTHGPMGRCVPYTFSFNENSIIMR